MPLAAHALSVQAFLALALFTTCSSGRTEVGEPAEKLATEHAKRDSLEPVVQTIDSLVITAYSWDTWFSNPMSHRAFWRSSTNGVFPRLETGQEYAVVRDSAVLERFALTLKSVRAGTSDQLLHARLSALIFMRDRVDTLSIGIAQVKLNDRWLQRSRDLTTQLSQQLSPKFHAQSIKMFGLPSGDSTRSQRR